MKGKGFNVFIGCNKELDVIDSNNLHYVQQDPYEIVKLEDTEEDTSNGYENYHSIN